MPEEHITAVISQHVLAIKLLQCVMDWEDREERIVQVTLGANHKEIYKQWN